jgi:hypothetical protein
MGAEQPAVVKAVESLRGAYAALDMALHATAALLHQDHQHHIADGTFQLFASVLRNMDAHLSALERWTSA